MPRETIVIALGGNSLLKAGEKFSIHKEIKNIENSCRVISRIIKTGYRVAITHGNGPQVGDILIQQEMAKGKVPEMPLDVCGAQSQGEIGYLLQRVLRGMIPNRSIVTLVTQVIVDRNDPGFARPSKFIGPFYRAMPKPTKGHEYRRDSGRGYRMVVPSPEPLEIVEKREIKKLMNDGFVVIACGGGGVPVVRKQSGLEGAEAVIDKDLASEKLATSLRAKTLLIITDVRKAASHYGSGIQKDINAMNIKEAEVYMMGGQFPPGSMGPKVEAAIRFIKHGGKRAIITDSEHAVEALRGKDGTIITR